MSCELVTTGWYASEQPRDYRTAGDEAIRGVGFRSAWWQSVDTFLAPRHVLVVDSAAPVKPMESQFTSTSVERLELLMNPGHSQNGKTHYCGAMAAIMLGMEYALFNDVDLFLYVEQDALLYGKSILDRTKNALRRRDLVFGKGEVDIQQSFFAANKKGLRRFMSALHSINYSDKQIAPENKFEYAGSRMLPSAVLKLAEHTSIDKLRRAGLILFTLACRMCRNYEFLPFGYGRDRPINFGDDVFYFQHASKFELDRYFALTGFTKPGFESSGR